MPCTCSSQAGSAGSPRRSTIRRAVVARPRAGTSPTCAPTLSESYGGALTPPVRSVNAARTFAQRRPVRRQYTDRLPDGGRRSLARPPPAPQEAVACPRAAAPPSACRARSAGASAPGAPRAAPGAETQPARRRAPPCSLPGCARRPPYRRVADDRESRRAPGARGSGGCARSRARRAPAVCARKRSHHAIVGHGRTAVAPHRHARALACGGARSAHRSCRPPVMTPVQTARYCREISRAASAATSARVGLGRTRHHQQPARVLVEPMHEPRPRHERELRIERRAARSAAYGAGLPAPGCTTSAGRLVDDEQGAVLEHDLERQLFGRDRRDPGRELRARRAPASPPRTRSRARSARPASCTAPDSIQACSRAREYCGNARASAWSKRRPLSSADRLSACERNSAEVCRGRRSSRGIRYTHSSHSAQSQTGALSR